MPHERLANGRGLAYRRAPPHAYQAPPPAVRLCSPLRRLRDELRRMQQHDDGNRHAHRRQEGPVRRRRWHQRNERHHGRHGRRPRQRRSGRRRKHQHPHVVRVRRGRRFVRHMPQASMLLADDDLRSQRRVQRDFRVREHVRHQRSGVHERLHHGTSRGPGRGEGLRELRAAVLRCELRRLKLRRPSVGRQAWPVLLFDSICIVAAGGGCDGVVGGAASGDVATAP